MCTWACLKRALEIWVDVQQQATISKSQDLSTLPPP